MDLKGLQYVVAVADAGSFTEAAKNLFVAQPALSRKIAQVEREFGTDFFVRSGQRVRLTEAGQVFYRGARQVLADWQRLEKDMDQFLRQMEALHIGYITDGEVPYVAEIVRAMREKYPNIDIYTQALFVLSGGHGSLAQILELLRQKRLDALLTFQPELREEAVEWLEHKCVKAGGLCAFTSQRHPLYGKERVCASELHKYTLVLPLDTFYPFLVRAIRQALGEPPRIVFAQSSTDFRVKVISENHVGVMPATSRSIESPFLHCADISDVPDGFDLEIVWPRGSEGPALRKLLSAL